MQQQLEQKIVEYFQNQSEVVAVYLFGSYAKGRESTSSDLDLALLLEREAIQSEFDLRKRYVQELGRILRKDIHLAIMNKAGEMLLAQIFKSGRLLLQRHSGLTEFMAYSYVLIADFMIYRKRAEKGFLQKMKGVSSD
jgi:hypothetical protein